jgi:hypothetical protein
MPLSNPASMPLLVSPSFYPSRTAWRLPERGSEGGDKAARRDWGRMVREKWQSSMTRLGKKGEREATKQDDEIGEGGRERNDKASRRDWGRRAREKRLEFGSDRSQPLGLNRLVGKQLRNVRLS